MQHNNSAWSYKSFATNDANNKERTAAAIHCWLGSCDSHNYVFNTDDFFSLAKPHFSRRSLCGFMLCVHNEIGLNGAMNITFWKYLVLNAAWAFLGAGWILEWEGVARLPLCATALHSTSPRLTIKYFVLRRLYDTSICPARNALPGLHGWSTPVQCNEVFLSTDYTLQCSAVQYGTVQYSTV